MRSSIPTFPRILLVLLSAVSTSLACIYIPNAAPGQVMICQCYNSFYGVDRRHLLDAADAFCRAFDGHTWGPPRTHYTSYGIKAHYYDATPHTLEEGMITAQLTWTGGWRDNPNVCDQWPWTLTYEKCVRAFRDVVDLCDTSSENGKQGGWGVDDCLEWKMDPNPWQNEPGVPVPKESPSVMRRGRRESG